MATRETLRKFMSERGIYASPPNATASGLWPTGPAPAAWQQAVLQKIGSSSSADKALRFNAHELEATDFQGQTLLHVAVLCQNLPAVLALLKSDQSLLLKRDR